MARGNLYRQRPTGNKVQLYLWINCFLIGLSMGTISFIMDILVEALCNMKTIQSQKLFVENINLGWLSDIGFSLMYALFAAIITIYIAPVALGSGVAECMGMLNGV